jgi:fucose 4-O-acetylase-like acetyltransferase
MKEAEYGVPFLTFVLSLACIVVIFTLSRSISEGFVLSRLFRSLGASSMGIMYLHEFFVVTLRQHGVNGWLTFLVSVPAAWALTRIIAAFSPVSLIFLGSAKASGA